ncbi:hypothetical protein EW145_g5515 [Phellinidium pouzarii]|uniref:Uncharacterized protein n=1 Tax=Phellinidium pouzarii TaxID=167371 RepID=A0A4S4L098_9AGAM|nr:hypothetical protein EW145_g5515 [Phellinidium pouzarii]
MPPLLSMFELDNDSGILDWDSDGSMPGLEPATDEFDDFFGDEVRRHLDEPLEDSDEEAEARACWAEVSNTWNSVAPESSAGESDEDEEIARTRHALRRRRARQKEISRVSAAAVDHTDGINSDSLPSSTSTPTSPMRRVTNLDSNAYEDMRTRLEDVLDTCALKRLLLDDGLRDPSPPQHPLTFVLDSAQVLQMATRRFHTPRQPLWRTFTMTGVNRDR